MPSTLIRITTLASLLALHACGTASTCEANWFSDCLGLGGCQRTAAYPNTATTCYAVGNTCNPATPTVLQQQLVNFAPQTTYQTRWASIPVTTYRPITTTDPVTGCTVTRMRPCTSYQLQARRVPVTQLRPVYSTIAVNTAPLPTYHVPATTPVVLPHEAGCGTELPYYGSPAGGSPSRAAPADFPSLPASPLQSAPGIPARPVTPGGTPADRPPTLDPSRLQGATPSNPHNVRLLPVVPEPATAPVAPAAEPAPAVAPALTDIEVKPLPTREVPATVPVTRPPLQPIPDPDELNLEPATGTPVPNSRDKVALRNVGPSMRPATRAPEQGRIIPIRWPAESPSAAPARTTTASLERPQSELPQTNRPQVSRPQSGLSQAGLQDTGWTSLRP